MTVRGREDQPVVISRAWAEDTRLSYQARGLLLALMAMLPDNEFQTDADAQEAVRELETTGYLVLQPGGVDHLLVDPWAGDAR